MHVSPAAFKVPALESQEELAVAGLTVGFLSMLPEGALLQLHQAVGTDEVLRVELVPHGTDATPSNRPSTAMAHRPLPLVEVKLTVWAAI